MPNTRIQDLFIRPTAMLCLIYSVTGLSDPIEPIMVTVPSGSFEMGSTKYRSTQPVHNVDIKEFSIGKYEVTVSEFRQFIEATGYETPQECRHEMDAWFLLFTPGNWETNALNTSEYQPVVCINWQAANDYAKWLSKETGKPYRLPSEAEWEYAARAGTTTDYFFGDDPDNTQVCEYANVGDLYGESILQRDSDTSYQNWSGDIANCNDHSAYGSIVGMYKANQFGLHDTLSNVLEFTADCVARNYEETPTDGSAYLGGECKRHITRGGSWHWSHWPVYNRGSVSLDFSGGVDGFRLALDGAAPAESEATRQHRLDLNFAQQQERKRRAQHRPIPEPVTHVKLNQEENKITLNWEYSEKSHDISYRVYRNAVKDKMFKLLADNITTTHFIDANSGPNEYEYTVVAVKQHMQSQYSPSVLTQASYIDASQRIEAEWAVDQSGSSVSYAEYGDRDGFSLKGNVDDEQRAQLKYELTIPESGDYQLYYHVSAPETIEAFEISVDGTKLANAVISKTGDEKVWETQQAIQLSLKEGQHSLALQSLNDNWKLDWLELRRIDS